MYNNNNSNRAKSKKDPQLYVLKKIQMKGTKIKMQVSAVNEAKILSNLDHPNVIKFYTSFMEGDYLYILMEYAQKGDLYNVSLNFVPNSDHFFSLDFKRTAQQEKIHK